ncbi:solute carrier family 32 (vesicular inhibitory amino acid transporter) [Cryptococcus neoformans]|nr:solute carrier family 32 (vesicular inhibitory amino acid transporter) [Cryptococcus neoformans var. grubii Bt1]OXH22906.1 solute carrier family 32 (vesicular inhibitory amino acid transporter) [Cryptococcus neoformans var. grubii]
MVSRVVITALCVGIAVVLPGFGRVMAFLGSFSAFLICIILPLLFYIRLSPTLLPSCPLSPHSPISSPDCPLATHVKMDQRQIYEYDALGIGNRQYGADDSRDCMGVPARKWA